MNPSEQQFLKVWIFFVVCLLVYTIVLLYGYYYIMRPRQRARLELRVHEANREANREVDVEYNSKEDSPPSYEQATSPPPYSISMKNEFEEK